MREVEFDYAGFINAVLTFLITAAVIYFLVVLPLRLVNERRRRGEAAGSDEPTELELLTEIRDLLRAQQAAVAPDTAGDGDASGTGDTAGAGGAGGTGGTAPGRPG